MLRVLDVLGALSVVACAVGIAAVLYATAVRGLWLETGIGAAAGLALLMAFRGSVTLWRLAERLRGPRRRPPTVDELRAYRARDWPREVWDRERRP